MPMEQRLSGEITPIAYTKNRAVIIYSPNPNLLAEFVLFYMWALINIWLYLYCKDTGLAGQNWFRIQNLVLGN